MALGLGQDLRCSAGTRIDSSRAAVSAASGRGPFQWKTAPLLSMERMAFWRASVKDRPMAMASPTDFMVVVSVGSALRNFSKAKRGTLTTT